MLKLIKKFIRLIIGDMEDKRTYRRTMKRINALPKDYRFAFHKIQHYMFCVGSPDGDMTIFNDMSMFMDLLELFETSAADGKKVIDVIGSDVGKFSDELMHASSTSAETSREKLNKEILRKIKRKGE